MFIGLDIGGTGIKGVIADKDGKIYATGRTLTPKTGKEIDQAINTLARSLADDGGIPFNRIKAIGIGSAGSIDGKNGKIITSPNIPAWRNYPLAKNIEKLTGKKTFLENDANVAVMGELWQGRGANYSNWFMLTLGTGIGGGAIVDGKLLYGRNGVAAEFGHINIEPDGNQCGCGNRGCFEAYASAPALVRRAQSLLKKYPSSTVASRIKTEELSAKLVAEEYAKKDPLAVETMDTVAYYLGIGISHPRKCFQS